MSAYSSIFGENLISKSSVVPVSSLDDKYVGVYFSAHWCGNCRQFTPKLRKIYLELKKQDVPFEIVFEVGSEVLVCWPESQVWKSLSLR